jgi:zinc protease
MRRWREFAVALLFIAAACIAAVAVLPSAAAALGTVGGKGPEIRVADNVLLVPDKNARSISGWLIVLAGCADEEGGQCVGLAHYLEHLLFINRDKEHRSKVAIFPDGSGNGWTSHRATTYFQRFPAQQASNAENLDRLFGYFAGLLTNLKVDDEQAARERNVVMQEYQQNTGRNPFARFGTVLSRALMPDEPLGQRVIGSPQSIAAFTVEAARAFHERWYARNNAFVVLHGPLEAADIAPLVERHLAPLPVKPIPARSWKAPRNYEAGHRLIQATDRDARQTAISIERLLTFVEKEDERGDNDAAMAIIRSFLASRLAGSPSADLVERDEIVTDARISVGRVRDGTLRVAFSGTPASGVAAEKVLEAARGYIEELSRRGLTQQAVDRLKKRITNERALLAEQPASYAQALGAWLATHLTHEDWVQRQAKLEAVSRERINRLLAIIGQDSREVAGILLPDKPTTTGSVGADKNSTSGGPTATPPAEASPQ